jgi:hypothetical protein
VSTHQCPLLGEKRTSAGANPSTLPNVRFWG